MEKKLIIGAVVIFLAGAAGLSIDQWLKDIRAQNSIAIARATSSTLSAPDPTPTPTSSPSPEAAPTPTPAAVVTTLGCTADFPACRIRSHRHHGSDYSGD